MTSRREFIGTAALTTLMAAAGMPADARERKRWQWKPYGTSHVIDGASGAEVLETKSDDPEYPAMVKGLRESGITCVVATIAPWGGSKYSDKKFEETKQRLADWTAGIERHKDLLRLVRDGADLELCREDRKLGVVYTFQGAEPIVDDLDRVALFRTAGVRVIQITHNYRNLIGDGSLEPGNAGLSRIGHELIERLNVEKIVVDVAHGSQRTMREGILASKQPVLISHSGCRALADTPRLVYDDELKLLGDRGGVVGIIFWPYLRAQGQQTSADVIRHIEHAIDVCGEDHVGIGTDVRITPEHVTPKYRKENLAFIQELIGLDIFAKDRDPDLLLFPPDLNRADHMDVLAHLMSKRGFGDARIEKVIGGNFARVMKEVWG